MNPADRFVPKCYGARPFPLTGRENGAMLQVSHRTEPMPRIKPLPELTDEQLLKKANRYGIRAFVGDALRSFGRQEAEKVLADFMRDNDTLRVRNWKSHTDRIKAEHGTHCQCCGQAKWTQICHIVQPDPGDPESGGKENSRVLSQSDYSVVEELLSRAWLGCQPCHTGWDGNWSRNNPRNRESLARFFVEQKSRVENGLKTRDAARVAKKVAGNEAELDKLYDRSVCHCCQRKRKTELAHIYGEYGKIDRVSQLTDGSTERCVNEGKKCLPMCKKCHNTFDKTNSATKTQNPATLEQICRDKIEELGLGLEGHRQLDLWLEEMGSRLSTVDWPKPKLLFGPLVKHDPKPKCPSAKDYPLGKKDLGWKKAKYRYNSELEKWNKRNVPGFREAKSAKKRARSNAKRAEDKWC